MNEIERDADYMSAALALGRRNLGRALPNPAVGAIVARDGVIVGRGFTDRGDALMPRLSRWPWRVRRRVAPPCM